MESAFRIYQNGVSLVFVLFPIEGGEAIIRKSWSLDSIDLQSSEVPDRRNNATGEYSVPSRKSLVRGGFKIKIDYESERIQVIPLTRQNNELNKYRVVYRFEDLGVEDDRDDPIEWQMNSTELLATLDRLPSKRDS